MAEIDFKYSDCDKHSAEMSELYTYSEAEDFILNFEAFSRYVDEKKVKIYFNRAELDWLVIKYREHYYLAFPSRFNI